MVSEQYPNFGSKLSAGTAETKAALVDEIIVLIVSSVRVVVCLHSSEISQEIRI
jgi:hypothetical protein